MKNKNLKVKISDAINQSDDTELLKMIWHILQDSTAINPKNKNKKTGYDVGEVSYGDVLRQGQGCLPPGK